MKSSYSIATNSSSSVIIQDLRTVPTILVLVSSSLSSSIKLSSFYVWTNFFCFGPSVQSYILQKVFLRQTSDDYYTSNTRIVLFLWKELFASSLPRLCICYGCIILIRRLKQVVVAVANLLVSLVESYCMELCCSRDDDDDDDTLALVSGCVILQGQVDEMPSE